MYGYDNSYASAGYGYNGGYEGATPDMRRRLANMQQAQQRYQQYGIQQQNMIQGRIVTGIEEARAAQIPLDGTLVYFPAPGERKIYVKSVNLDGQPVFEVYQLTNGQEEKAVYADSTVVAELQKRIERLETLFMKGAGTNVQSDANAIVESNANNGAVTSQQ